MADVLTVTGVDRQKFEHDLRPLNVPVLMKGLVADWPAVQAAKQSPAVCGTYLKAYDVGIATPVSVLPAHEGRQYFYDSSTTGLNYRTVKRYLPDIIDRLIEQADDLDRECLYMQSLPVATFLPRLLQDNRLSLVPETVLPRIWIGNRLTIQTHFDRLSNVACVVAGKRRFTLFPPDQIANLYPGPDDFTPGGAPISMASLDEPDFDRYPRLALALERRLTAEMEPGDGLYVPYAWWHRVQSLSGFNVLVNYWWDDADPSLLSPKAALRAALLGLRHLPEEQRAAWKTVFDYYVFETSGDPVSHLTLESQGSFGPLTPDRIKALKDLLRAELGR